MKKYLLIGTNTTKNDYDVDTVTYVVGSFDTIAEAKEAALDDLQGLATDDAYSMYPDEDCTDFHDYIAERMEPVRDHRLEDSDFCRVSEGLVLLDCYYENGWIQINSYMLVKVGE